MESLIKIEPSAWDRPESWDADWALEWYKIEQLFLRIDQLKGILNDINVPTMYRISQEQVILNLERYAYSLSNFIANKYK